MNPHQTQNFLEDGSSAIRIYPGGRWKVGKMNGHIYDSMAQKFCDEQNAFVRDFHWGSVARVRREGKP